MNCNTSNAHLFDSSLPSERAQAKWLCRSCPVRESCLQDAFSLLNTENPPRSIYAGAAPGNLSWLKSSPAARERHFAKLDAMEEPREPTPEERRALLATKSREFRGRRRAEREETARLRERRLDRIFVELVSS